ncbi:cytochrome c556 [Altererythrobacter atlanticus]|uniref:Uncharacterized protein n=2 Tax=Croceibacterium atlanticum TaxID=1267766 RepID=A0A0F7KRG7_9SPHN|nr:hypothetical protein [Croceibacterium atlanticum]AKH42194.1 hypothetical protein WYH_01148 [Croceibacterium atlanticum]MBB5733994.1 cytochrome c556 [Croceibacterium atlanticum]
MVKRILAAACIPALLAGCGGTADQEDAAGETYVQAHTIQQLMANVVQPTAENYWNSVQYISDEDGNHEIEPETDEDWQRTRAAGATIAELGNLLMTPAYSEGRGEDWTQFSQSLVEVGLRAEEAAVNKDVDAVFEVGGTVYSVCSACHQVYPPENMPEDAPTGEPPA